MTPDARRVPDTDWHVSRLYAFARDLGASLIVPRYSRYLVDLNRPPDDTSLYPGQNTTGLCPRVQFSGAPVYLEGQEPDAAEIAARVQQYWRPYHDALAQEIARFPQVCMRADRRSVYRQEGLSLDEAMRFEWKNGFPAVQAEGIAGAARFASGKGRGGNFGDI